MPKFQGQMVHLKREPKGPIDVLITDGHTRAALAVARALSQHGISNLTLAEHPRCLTYYSLFTKHLLLAPSPRTEPEAFLESALTAVNRYKIQLVIPITDQTLFLFDQHRHRFSGQTKLAISNSQAVRCVLDKRLNLELAKKLGVPCPRQFELKDNRQIPEMIETLGFPIVLKNPGEPYDSRMLRFSFRAIYAYNEKELYNYIAEHCQTGVYPIFQEFVSGEVHNLCCFAIHGEVVAIHEYISLRRRKGEGVFREILELSPDLEENTRRLLQSLKWGGVAHVSFIVSKDHKKKWYMETNGRFWASTQGSIYAGWNFPYWTYNYFLHGKKPKPDEIKIGSKTCWHLGDLLALLIYLGRGLSPTMGSRPKKLFAIFQYLSGFFPGIHSDVFRWNDPVPAILEHWQLLERAWRVIKRKLA